jgi:hypothetical protein
MSESPRQLFAVPGPVFKAKYPGKCGLCGKQFPARERIRYIADKTVAHKACVVAKGRSAHSRRRICDPVLSDERARENMRSHKPSTWRLGKSPSSYG